MNEYDKSERENIITGGKGVREGMVDKVNIKERMREGRKENNKKKGGRERKEEGRV